MALTPKQARFAEEYVIDLNGAAAAARAGYSERSAKITASRLLTNANIQAAVREAQAARSQRTQITADAVLRELANLALANNQGRILDFSGDEVKLRPANQIPEEVQRCISSFKVKRYVEGHGDDAKVVEVVEYKLWSKDAALHRLMQHLGLLKESGTPPATPAVAVNVSVINERNSLTAADLAAAAALLGMAGLGVPPDHRSQSVDQVGSPSEATAIPAAG